MSGDFALFPDKFPVSSEFWRQRDVIGGLPIPPGIAAKKECYSLSFFSGILGRIHYL